MARGAQEALIDVRGIIFDQGGRSCEFAIINKHGEIKHTASVPLGTFSISDQEHPQEYVNDQLATLPKAYKKLVYTNLYAIGGTPKNLMDSLRIEQEANTGLHGYTASISDTMQHIQKIEHASFDDLTALYNIKSVRAPLIPACTELMKAMHEAFASEHIIVSTAGVRDGLIAEQQDKFASDGENDFETKPSEIIYG